MVAATFRNISGALRDAVKDKNVEKVKYLLDRGVNPNLDTLTLKPGERLIDWRPFIDANDNEKCVLLLLEYGADPYLFVWQLLRTDYFVIYYGILGREPPPPKIPKFLLSYLCIYEAAGVKTVSFSSVETRKIEFVNPYIRKVDNFYNKCLQDIETLKKHEIRENLTMFTIVYKTGCELIELLNEEDCKIVDSFIADYEKEMTLNVYYMNALRVHMEQMRKLIACKNEAMLVISASTEVLTPFLVLDKIVSYLSYEDLLMFQ